MELNGDSRRLRGVCLGCGGASLSQRPFRRGVCNDDADADDGADARGAGFAQKGSRAARLDPDPSTHTQNQGKSFEDFSFFGTTKVAKR